jgi:putative FmdB family regulatory protein
MPLYEFECEKCGWRDDLYFVKADESYTPQSCPVCEATLKRHFPLTSFNVMNASYKPGCETKWNWNPARAFSDVPGGGAEYEHRRRELRTGNHRFDIGPHSHEWAHHLKGTKRDMRRRGKLPPHKRNVA